MSISAVAAVIDKAVVHLAAGAVAVAAAVHVVLVETVVVVMAGNVLVHYNVLGGAMVIRHAYYPTRVTPRCRQPS